ncbi:hypothetical protein Hanom_Chr06g00506861 [Helianthus anomalus]
MYFSPNVTLRKCMTFFVLNIRIEKHFQIYVIIININPFQIRSSNSSIPPFLSEQTNYTNKHPISDTTVQVPCFHHHQKLPASFLPTLQGTPFQPASAPATKFIPHYLYYLQFSTQVELHFRRHKGIPICI